jgi:hypothetical protein
MFSRDAGSSMSYNLLRGAFERRWRVKSGTRKVARLNREKSGKKGMTAKKWPPAGHAVAD